MDGEIRVTTSRFVAENQIYLAPPRIPSENDQEWFDRWVFMYNVGTPEDGK